MKKFNVYYRIINNNNGQPTFLSPRYILVDADNADNARVKAANVLNGKNKARLNISVEIVRVEESKGFYV